MVAIKWIWEHYAPPATWLHPADDEPCLWDLVVDDPEIAWPVILLIHQLVDTEFIRGALSSGPVEDLLVHHGPRFIERIEVQARTDPKFALMLGGVWQSEMRNYIWKRVNAVWDRRGWDGTPTD